MSTLRRQLRRWALAVAAIALLLHSSASAQEAMEQNTNRQGMDYRSFDLSVADPALCRDACARESQCQAWTYVKPNTVQGPAPRCWLKTGVPAPRAETCCISGAKAHTGVLPLPVAALTGRTWEFARGDGSVISRTLTLLPDGRIGGYANPNEARWSVEGNTLVFYNTGGRPSTRFTMFRQEAGRWVISGPFLLGGNVTHILREVRTPPGNVPGGSTGGSAGGAAGGGVQPGINLPGMDYRNFNLAAADPALCRDACAREAQCQAWTYVKPNTVQGPAPRCWLKTGVPTARADPCCDSGVKSGGAGPGPVPGNVPGGATGGTTGGATGGGMQPGINLPGMDYRNFDLTAADASLCRDACAREAQCRAWTYVKPNTVQGPAPRCWLKTGVPTAKADPCCVSGVKGGGVGPGPAPATGPGADAWNDSNGRALIDEWLRQVEGCTREVFPASHIDSWARICGRVTTGTIDCSLNPDHPGGWDSYRYLWEHNFCTQFYSIRLRDYVARRAAGTPAQSLHYCKRNENGPCF